MVKSISLTFGFLILFIFILQIHECSAVSKYYAHNSIRNEYSTLTDAKPIKKKKGKRYSKKQNGNNDGNEEDAVNKAATEAAPFVEVLIRILKRR